MTVTDRALHLMGLILILPLASADGQAADTVTRWRADAYVDLAYAASNDHPGNELWRSKSTTSRVDRLTLNNGAIGIQLRDGPDSRWAFGAGLQVGEDIDNLTTSSSDLAGVLKHLYYTYLSYRAPVGGQELIVTGGLIPGHLGYESFRAVDNPTYTRIYGVDNVPYFQWGVSVKYPGNGPLSGELLVVSGWDYLATPNGLPSYGGRVQWDLGEAAWIRGNAFYGPEQENTSLDFWRLALEGIGQVRFGDVELVGNLGWGRERQAAVPGQPLYQWSWAAVWFNWRPGDGRWTVGLRPEVFRDEDGLLTGARQTLTALTGALRYELSPQPHHLQIRAEYRFDRSTGPDGGFFDGPSNVLVPNQQLVFLAVNYRFDTPVR